jgi:hypothetical protein
MERSRALEGAGRLAYNKGYIGSHLMVEDQFSLWVN